jgi:hypothetical protein
LPTVFERFTIKTTKARITPRRIDSIGNPGMLVSGFPTLLDVVLVEVMLEAVVTFAGVNVKLESLK